jgi:hypothetical protein
LLEHIQKFCFFGKLCFVNPSGDYFENPIPLSVKLEDLLKVVLAKRREIAAKAGLSDNSLSGHRATESEMKDMTNAWRKNVHSWMCIRNQALYWDLLAQRRAQEAHQFARTRFSTYCFQISGCKFLLKKLIELPIIHSGRAARPAPSTLAVVKDLLEAFQEHKQTDAYKTAVSNSTKRMEDQERTSRLIWWARANLQRGRTLARQRDVGSLSYFDLSLNDQKLVVEYDTRKAERTLSSLAAARSPIYRGTHVEAST